MFIITYFLKNSKINFSLRSIPLILYNEKITREHSKEHSLIIFWWTRGEFALDFCKARSKIFLVNALQKSSVTVQKQSTGLFSLCVRFPSYNFRAKLKERDKTLSFNFGGLEGNSLLNFARQRAKVVKLCLAKSFGHRSKTVHWTVFSLRSIPLILCNEK